MKTRSSHSNYGEFATFNSLEFDGIRIRVTVTAISSPVCNPVEFDGVRKKVDAR